MEVVTNLKFKYKSDRSQVVLYFPKSIEVVDQTKVKSLLSTVAEIGSYMGLILGVSLLDLERINFGSVIRKFNSL